MMGGWESHIVESIKWPRSYRSRKQKLPFTITLLKGIVPSTRLRFKMYSMAAQWHRLQSSDGILLFGPLGSSCDHTTRRDLQQMVIDNGDNAWIHGIITELPLHWKRIATAIPTLDTASGRHQLHHLPLAVRSDESKLTNTALIPLVLLHQLKQYERLVCELHPGARDPFAEPGHVQETAGLCVGLLSALVVSSARCRAEFQRYTAIAAHLALLIGMVIDADASSDEYQAMGIAWDATQQDSVQSLLTEFPDVCSQWLFADPLSDCSPGVHLSRLRPHSSRGDCAYCPVGGDTAAMASAGHSYRRVGSLWPVPYRLPSPSVAVHPGLLRRQCRLLSPRCISV